MSEYNFNVIKKDIKFRRRNLLNPKKTIFNTNARIKENTLYLMTTRKWDRIDRKYNNVTEGSCKIDINNIQSIKFKPGFAFGSNINNILLLIVILLSFCSVIYLILHYWALIINNLFGFTFLPLIVFLIAFLGSLSNLTFKCIQITYKDNIVIGDKTNRKIVFPISGLFYWMTPRKIKEQSTKFINELIKTNSNIHYKRDKLCKIFILVIVIALIVCVAVPLYYRQKNIENNNLSYNLNNNLLYSKVTFERGTLINIEKEKYTNKYICTFKIQGKNEEAKIENSLGIDYGELRNIYKIDYYKKEDNTYFSSEYRVGYTLSNVGQVTSLGINYYYDYINNKMFSLNNLNDSDITTYESYIYYKDETKDTLYDFLYSSENLITSFDNFDTTAFKVYEYKSIIKIGNYDSKYGECYILKAVSDSRTDYFMYIENKFNTNNNSFDGILLSSRISEKKYFTDDATSVDTFKYILAPQ